MVMWLKTDKKAFNYTVGLSSKLKI